MTEAQKDALRIVLDLARDNALDPEDHDEDTAWELQHEALKQQRAIRLIEQMLEKEDG